MFKVGDKVRRIKYSHQGMFPNMEDTIIEIEDYDSYQILTLKNFSYGHDSCSFVKVFNEKIPSFL